MKKILKYFAYIIIGLIVIAYFVSLTLPGEYKVSRSVIINVPADSIYPLIINLKNWQKWTTWTNQLDSTITYQYAEPATGPGASMSWKGKVIGEGSLKIVSASPAKTIDYDLMLDAGKFIVKGKFLFEIINNSYTNQSNSTKVTWENSGKLNDPVSKFFGLMMDSQMGPDFEKALDNLKKLMEKK